MNRMLPASFLFIIAALFLTACRGRTPFEEGHAWIVPRPAAEFQITVLKANSQALPDATLWLLYGGEHIHDTARLPDYDPEIGIKTGPDGTAVIRYLGETGGGFEVPLNQDQPEFELLVEAPDGKTHQLSLDTPLFRSEFHAGQTTVTYSDETLTLHIIPLTISFGDE